MCEGGILGKGEREKSGSQGKTDEWNQPRFGQVKIDPRLKQQGDSSECLGMWQATELKDMAFNQIQPLVLQEYTSYFQGCQNF